MSRSLPSVLAILGGTLVAAAALLLLPIFESAGSARKGRFGYRHVGTGGARQGSATLVRRPRPSFSKAGRSPARPIRRRRCPGPGAPSSCRRRRRPRETEPASSHGAISRRPWRRSFPEIVWS